MIKHKYKLYYFFVILIGFSVTIISSFYISDSFIYMALLLGALISIVSILFMHQQIKILKLKQLTIPSFFYWSYIFIIFIPSFFVYFENPGLPGERYIFGILGVLIFFPVGVFIANQLFRFKVSEIESYYVKPIIKDTSFSKIEKTIWMFLGLAIVLMCTYLFEVLPTIGGHPPILKLFSGGENYLGIVQLREDSLKLLDSPLKYFYILLKDFYFPLLTILSLTIHLVYKRRDSWRLFLFTLFLALFYGSFTLAKAPVAFIFFLLILCFYVFKKGEIKKRYLLLIPGLVFLFPIIVVVSLFTISGNDKGIFDAIMGIFNRIFITPAESIFNFFEIFPFEKDFVYGRTIGKLNFLLFREPLDMNAILVNHAFIQGPTLESVNMSGGFIGYFNADFGLPGVFILTLLTGFLLQFIQIHFLRKEKTIPRFASYVFIICSTIFINLTSVPNTILQHGMLFAFIFPFIFSVGTNFIRTLAEISSSEFGKFSPKTFKK